MTPPELLLWDALRAGRFAGLKFRRQHPLGPYVIDFYCAALRLGLEVDGTDHYDPEAVAYDQRRDAWLAQYGLRLIRIPAHEILSSRAAVLARLQARLRPRGSR